jgi:hypothetical protein
MALGSTQPVTEMCTRNHPGSKGRPALKADNLTAICEPIVKKMWEPRRLKPYGPQRPVTGMSLPFGHGRGEEFIYNLNRRNLDAREHLPRSRYR